MVSRRYLLVSACLAAASAQAQEDEAPRRVILDASRALQAGNAARFMGYFDERKFGAFAELRRTVTALLEARTAASSVAVTSIADSSDYKAIRVDWILQLTPIAGPGEIETRRRMIELTLAEQSPGVWRIVNFVPTDFLRVL